MDIRRQRERAGLTQAALARAAQVPQPNLSAYENGRRRPTSEVLARVESALLGRPFRRVAQRRGDILAAVARHRAHSPQVFGSVARGDDGPESDLDLLVSFADGATLLDLIGLQQELEEMLGVSVDVVDANGLCGEFGKRVQSERVAL